MGLFSLPWFGCRKKIFILFENSYCIIQFVAPYSCQMKTKNKSVASFYPELITLSAEAQQKIINSLSYEQDLELMEIILDASFGKK